MNPNVSNFGQEPQKIALDIIREFFSLFGLSGHTFLGFGALLGAVRSQQFAGKPSDVDLIVVLDHGQNLNSMIEKMENSGFELKSDKRISVKDYITLQKYGMTLDIVCYRKISFFSSDLVIRLAAEEGWYLSDFFPMRIVQIHGEEFPAPNNSQLFLNEWYGNDWSTPFPFERYQNLSRKEITNLIREKQRKKLHYLAKVIRFVFLRSSRFQKFWVGDDRSHS